MTNIKNKRLKEIEKLLGDDEILSRLSENDLACFAGYIQGMIDQSGYAKADTDKSSDNRSA